MDRDTEYGPQPSSTDIDWDAMSFRAKTVETTTVTLTSDAVEKMRIDKVNDATRHKRVALDQAKAIANARVGLRMTQKQLAAKLSIDHQLIASIEAGTAVNNAPLLERIRRMLGIKANTANHPSWCRPNNT
jgi:ribosome-binding protein aMBF1 (putative translation factor)